MLFSTALVSAAVAGLASAATHHVKVGASGLTFEPDTVTADIGDVVQFDFYPSNHSVAQSSYDSPCEPLSPTEAIYSGFIPSKSGKADESFAITLNNTASIWLYCSAPSHCQAGMVMVINPPANGINLGAYKAKAAKATDSGSPLAVGGGVIVKGGSSSSSSGSSSATATSASASGSSSPSASASASGTGASASASATASNSGSSSASGTSSAAAKTSTSAAAAAGSVTPTGFLGAVMGLVLGALL